MELEELWSCAKQTQRQRVSPLDSLEELYPEMGEEVVWEKAGHFWEDGVME